MKGESAVTIFLILAGGLITIVIVILGGMIVFGAENPPPKLASMNDPFEKVDFSDLPPLETVSARRSSPISFAAGSRPATLALPSSWSMDQQGPAQAFIRLARRSLPAASRSMRPISAATARQAARAISITPNSSTTTSKTSSPRSRQCNQVHGLCSPAFPEAGDLPCMPPLYLSDSHLSGLC